MAAAEICSEVSCSNYDPQAMGELCERHQERLRLQHHNGQFAGQFNATPEQQERHSTGAVRSTDANAYRFDLIPQRMLERVAKVMATGEKKYGPHNWEKGFAWSSVMNHLQRHANLYLLGDKAEDHLAHMICNLGFLIEFETTHPELNDIPNRGGTAPQKGN